jgi:hypothetical protein
MDRIVYDRRASMLEELRELGLLLDRMSWETLTDGPGEAAISLIDASQAVHRALIALGSDEPRKALSC